MERLAAVRRRLYANLPVGYRIKVALFDLIAGMDAKFFKKPLNMALQAEMRGAGVVVPGDIDFFDIIHRAVLSRIKPGSPDYDDFFQDVIMGFLDRNAKTGPGKRWTATILKLQAEGQLKNEDDFRAWLSNAARMHVFDMSSSKVKKDKRKQDIRTPGGDADEGGVDLERMDGGSVNPEDDLTAKKLYDAIEGNLKREESKIMLRILTEQGIKGFLRGKGLSEMARAYGPAKGGEVPSPTMMSYYRDRIFKPDFEQALRRIGDPTLTERAREIFANMRTPRLAAVCAEIATLSE